MPQPVAALSEQSNPLPTEVEKLHPTPAPQGVASIPDRFISKKEESKQANYCFVLFNTFVSFIKSCGNFTKNIFLSPLRCFGFCKKETLKGLVSEVINQKIPADLTPEIKEMLTRRAHFTAIYFSNLGSNREDIRKEITLAIETGLLVIKTLQTLLPPTSNISDAVMNKIGDKAQLAAMDTQTRRLNPEFAEPLIHRAAYLEKMVLSILEEVVPNNVPLEVFKAVEEKVRGLIAVIPDNSDNLLSLFFAANIELFIHQALATTKEHIEPQFLEAIKTVARMNAPQRVRLQKTQELNADGVLEMKEHMQYVPEALLNLQRIITCELYVQRALANMFLENTEIPPEILQTARNTACENIQLQTVQSPELDPAHLNFHIVKNPACLDNIQRAIQDQLTQIRINADPAQVFDQTILTALKSVPFVASFQVQEAINNRVRSVAASLPAPINSYPNISQLYCAARAESLVQEIFNQMQLTEVNKTACRESAYNMAITQIFVPQNTGELCTYLVPGVSEHIEAIIRIELLAQNALSFIQPAGFSEEMRADLQQIAYAAATQQVIITKRLASREHPEAFYVSEQGGSLQTVKTALQQKLAEISGRPPTVEQQLP